MYLSCFLLAVSGKEPMSKVTDAKHQTFVDCVFISIVSFLSSILFVFQLGFYSDDWAFLGNFRMSADQSFVGLTKTFLFPPGKPSDTIMRPVQALYDSLLYKLFALDPLGYHLVNEVVFITIGILFYLVLKRLQVPRVIALAIPVVYVLLPHYSTDRFWYAAFQINLSICLYILSVYAGLRFIQGGKVESWYWMFVSLMAIVISTLSYEVVIPFIFLSIPLFWRVRRQYQPNARLILIIGSIVCVLLVTVFKWLTTTRLEHGPLTDISFNYIHYVGYIVHTATWINYKVFIVGLPHILWNILHTYPNPITVTAGVILGFSIFVYLYTTFSQKAVRFPERNYFFKLLCLSFPIFLLGYAIFFVNNNIGFTPTGIGNRVAIAGAIGVAFSIVGGFGWLCSTVVPRRFSNLVFCLLIACVCAANFIVLNTLATFWVSAYSQEQLVMKHIVQKFPSLPSRVTILLDGMCPYLGPAIVFESNWDLRGSLQVEYKDQSVRADVVKQNIQVKGDGIYTKIYDQVARYPYGNTFLYNLKTDTVYPLTNEASAKEYFQATQFSNINNCPNYSDGHGVDVF